jgi:hypothetical protein
MTEADRPRTVVGQLPKCLDLTGEMAEVLRVFGA